MHIFKVESCINVGVNKPMTMVTREQKSLLTPTQRLKDSKYISRPLWSAQVSVFKS